MKTTEEHVSWMAARLRCWGARLDKLGVGVEAAGEKATVRRRDRIAALRTKHHLVQARLDALGAAGGDEWEAFWTGVKGTWRDLVIGFKALKTAPVPRRRRP
ncbi:MAG: hypothetical protein JW751_10360 [Polyangiaceae bacterium]|nr:hypothetical protein [Polyangiaceae bacterium]